MPDLHTLRAKLVESPDSIGGRLRLRRWDMVRTEFPDIERMSVIDLGGRVEAWQRAPVRPAHVHVVNLEPPAADAPSWVEFDYADACDLPAAITSRSYDLVFSNSVIEHLGGHARRIAFADAVHALADRHWIQTPYRYFPIEPHWLFPWFQHLPVAARAYVSRRWPLVHTRGPTSTGTLDAVMGIELLSRTELQAYFPKSRIIAERVGPLPKSIVAVR